MQTSLIQQTKHFFIKELKTEWLNRFALFSILLMLVVSVFIVYTIDQAPDNKTWHAYLYLILIFGVVQNISRSFLAEGHGQMVYYRSMVDHRAYFLAKLCYQLLINLAFVLLLFGLMNFFMSQSIPHFWAYLVTVVLFTTCNAVIFTFNAAIASSARNSALVAGVLSLPLLIPSLMISLKAAAKAQMTIENVNFLADWAVLILLAILCGSLGFVLFKYLWRE